MKHTIEKRLAALEAGQGGQTESVNDPEGGLTRILIEAYYNDQEPQLTPEQEQMLKDTVQWYRNEGLDYLLDGVDP